MILMYVCVLWKAKVVMCTFFRFETVWHFPACILIVHRNSLILCKSECSKMRSVHAIYICLPFSCMSCDAHLIPNPCSGFIMELYYSAREALHLSKCMSLSYLDWDFSAH
jgi:hypothetical protein